MPQKKSTIMVACHRGEGMFCTTMLRHIIVVHDHPLYLVFPDVLSTVGETSYRIGVGFIE
jgi:hypothetical protein